MSLGKIAGVWRLDAFVFTDDAGDEHLPLGPSPVGVVTVTADGYLSLVFRAAERQDFAEDDLLKAQPGETAAAAASFVFFAGPCRIDGDQVVVNVEHSFFPNWTGGEQRRRFTLDGDTLTLATTRPILINGVERWGRASLTRS